MADDVDAFMATMVPHSQPLSLEQVLGLVREHYAVEAQATRLTGERDENFKVTAADGSDYVLKVAHPAENPAVTDLATAALLHLERIDPGLPCPRVVRTHDGRDLVAATASDPLPDGSWPLFFYGFDITPPGNVLFVAETFKDGKDHLTLYSATPAN